MTKDDEQEGPAVEATVMNFIRSRGPLASSFDDIEGATRLTREQIRRVVSKMLLRDRLFRFDVEVRPPAIGKGGQPRDDVYQAFYVDSEFTLDAHTFTPFRLSPEVARLYQGFGIAAPRKLKRTPSFISKAGVDEDREVFNRYRLYERREAEPVCAAATDRPDEPVLLAGAGGAGEEDSGVGQVCGVRDE